MQIGTLKPRLRKWDPAIAIVAKLLVKMIFQEWEGSQHAKRSSSRTLVFVQSSAHKGRKALDVQSKAAALHHVLFVFQQRSYPP